MAANQGFRGAFNEPYLYQESNPTSPGNVVSSSAFGLDNAASPQNIFKIAASDTPGVAPVDGQIWIDGSANGDVTIVPNGTGALMVPYLANGVIVTNATGEFQSTDGTTAGFVLTSNGTGVTPSFQAAGGVLSIASADTNLITFSSPTGAVTADLPNIQIDATSVAMGVGATIASTGNVGIGLNSFGSATGGANNVGVGNGTFFVAATGGQNVAIGSDALPVLTDGSYNVAVGQASMIAYTGSAGAGHNVAVGQSSLSAITTGEFNNCFGDFAGGNLNGTDSNNLMLGSYGITGDNNVVRVGDYGTGAHQQNIGYWLNGQLIMDLGANVFLGQLAGNTTLTGTDNVCIGEAAGTNLTSGSDNVYVGFQAGTVQTAGAGNTFVGPSAGQNNAGSFNTVFGNFSLRTAGATGDNNVVLGSASGNAYASTEASNILINNAGVAADANTIRIGTYGAGAAQQNQAYILAGNLILDLNHNVFLGSDSNAGNTTLSGQNNTMVGGNQGQSLTTGQQNVAVGASALGLVSTGELNTAVGAQSLLLVTTGMRNIAMGPAAGSVYTTETDNITIGHVGVAADANTLRLGTQGAGAGQQNLCFVAGITGATVVGAGVLCSATGQLGTIVSSERYKDNIEDIGYESDELMELRPVSFTYKSDKSLQKHYGLIAEEVEEVMPDLVIYDNEGLPSAVAYHELPALLLNEIQKLNKRIDALEKKKSVRVRGGI